MSFYSDGLQVAPQKTAPRAREKGVCVERWVFKANNWEERDKWHSRIFDAQLECLRRAFSNGRCCLVCHRATAAAPSLLLRLMFISAARARPAPAMRGTL